MYRQEDRPTSPVLEASEAIDHAIMASAAKREAVALRAKRRETAGRAVIALLVLTVVVVTGWAALSGSHTAWLLALAGWVTLIFAGIGVLIGRIPPREGSNASGQVPPGAGV